MLGTLKPHYFEGLGPRPLPDLSTQGQPNEGEVRYSPVSFCGPLALPVRTRRTPKLTVVLDLDETLIRAEHTPRPNFGEVVSVDNGGQAFNVYIGRRPKLLEFLLAASEAFELVLFTASLESYAERVLSLIDPHRKLLRYRLYRDSCVFHNGLYIKDLRCLGRDLRHVVLVDNNPGSFLLQPHNGIPISTWRGAPDDNELEVCMRFLHMLAQAEDVRPVLRQVCNFDPEVYYNHLYR
mmetsp:Transcript_3235/g.6663  ORF Transcript_3235/g.6663 Transcript_3235/m.6663 type:complete len:237 (-) Transcript_3235:13-723(-)